MRKKLVLAFLAVCALAHAQNEVTLVAPGGIRAAIEQLIPGFEAKTGIKVKATFGSGGGTKQQVIKGDVFDVPVVQPPYQPVLESGNVVTSTGRPLATVAVGAAVRKGAPKPDISTPEGIKKTLLAAKSITYPNPAGGAAAGVTFDQALKKLGIAEQVEPRLKRAQGGAAAMKMTADGEAEIGFTFMSEMEEPGLDIVGPLPREVATPTELSGFVSSKAKNPKAAQALLDYLSSPAAAPIYKANGMVASH